MRIRILQHSAADGPAAATDTLERIDAEVITTRVDKGDPIPKEPDADMLMLFGGACSLTASELPEWVAPEQELIRKYADSDRKVFGICFGAQLVASALGAAVRRNEQPEIGWHRIEKVAGSASPLIDETFDESTTVLQWHQDTFSIPDGASHLFQSDACVHQAYGIDDRVIGFQFHLEANERTVRLFLAASEKWKLEGEHVQTPDEIIAGIEKHLQNQNMVLERFLERWIGPVSRTH